VPGLRPGGTSQAVLRCRGGLQGLGLLPHGLPEVGPVELVQHVEWIQRIKRVDDQQPDTVDLVVVILVLVLVLVLVLEQFLFIGKFVERGLRQLICGQPVA